MVAMHRTGRADGGPEAAVEKERGSATNAYQFIHL